MPASTSPISASQAAPDRSTLLAFIAFIIVGGSAAIAIRFTFGEIAPYWGGLLRFGFAALIFWALMLIRKVPLPRGRALMGAALFGLLSVGLSFFFIYYGLTRTAASLYSTTAAIVPLLTLLFASAHGLERFRRRGVAGGLLSIIGITVAVSGSMFSGVDLSLPHILAIIAGAACFAEAGVVVKLFPPNHPFATNAVAMTVGALLLGTASAIKGESWALPSNLSVWLAVIYIIIGATVGAFLLYLFVLGRWTATGTSYGFVFVPIVTVVLAALFTDETISLLFLVGVVLVLVGVYIGALRPIKGKEKDSVKEDLQARPCMPNCI